jgi:ABC-type uncharacterized transport system substrate-binding protein
MSGIRRRSFITLIGGAAAAWPLAARAQQSSPALIGVLNASAATTFTKELDTLRGALRDLGHVEGRNVRFEYRFADGDLDRLPGLAAELVGLNPNVIVTFPLPTTLAVAKATSTIPIVMASGADPVNFGLAKSLSHPGGNVTGLTNFAEELASKQDRSHARIAAALGALSRADQRDKPPARATMARNQGRGCPGGRRLGAVRIPQP